MDRTVSRSLTNFALKFCDELGTSKTSVCSPLSTETLLALLALGCRGRARAELLQALDMAGDDAESDTSKTSVCSPLSAETVLALLALGCRGRARAELLQALGMADDDAIRSSFALVKSTLKSIKGATVNMANKVYLQKEATLKPAIKKDAEEVFGTDLEQLDFNEKEAAAGVINQWVAQKTNDLIKEIVTADTFKGETCVLLINAIFFRGVWEFPFKKDLTASRDFFIKERTVISVPQMSMSAVYFAYGSCKGLKAKLLRMPYRGGAASMVIVLPDEVEGLNPIMQQLARGYDLQTDIEAMRSTMIDVIIPKFKAETTINLKEVLAKLGIKSIFNKETSDIDMLTSEKRLFVTDAIQKAFIEVDEVGTEAAACTVMRMMGMCPRLNPKFTANRPFLYLLTCHEIPLFTGVYRGSE